MSGPDGDGAYTLQSLQELLGASRSDILGFIEQGFVTPSRGPRNSYRFAFRDVVLLRTAQGLRDADISAAKIRKSLKRLRALLPAELPLSGLRISAVGDTIAVREDGQAVAADSGQLLFDFEVAGSAGAVLSFPTSQSSGDGSARVDARPGGAAPPGPTWLEQGARWVDAKRPVEALAAYDAGLALEPHDADLQFNRAIVLEDLGRIDDAIDAYRRALEVRPDFADAHWNLARLYESGGVDKLALRHFSAYRRLNR